MDRRLVRDIRVLISAPRRIELAGAVDAEQAVVAGLVQVNDPQEGVLTYDVSVFEERYNEMGKQAVVILPE